MPLLRRGRTSARVTGAAYGVALTLEATPPELLDEMRAYLPPAWEDGATGTSNWDFRMTRDKDGRYELFHIDRVIAAGPEDEVLTSFEHMVRLRLATSSPTHFFLHAGAVAHQGQGIVIPGASFSGKTTLVSALVRAGAEYYTDENAVLDAQGLLHPYPKALGMRETPGEWTQTARPVSELGGVGGTTTVPVALVVASQYRPGASWEPATLSPADTIQMLMQHTVGGLERPAESMQVMRRAAEGVTALRGERGDADAVAADLIGRIGALRSG
jgi:hypothetical protein